MTRERCLLGGVAIACWLGSGCMSHPRNGTTLGSTSQPITFDGYTMNPNQQVSITMFNNVSQSWGLVTLTTTSSSPTGTDGAGYTWYPWSVTSKIYQHKNNWTISPWSRQATAQVKGEQWQNGSPIDLYTFDNGQATDTCINQSTSGAQIVSNCQSSQSPVVTLTGPCGVEGSVCCGIQNDDCDGDIMVCTAGNTCEQPSWPPPWDYSYLYDAPVSFGTQWTNDVQGVAHSGTNWYFTNMQSIIKIPLTDNIAAHTGVHENRGPTFYDPYFHYGDPTYSRETGHEGLFVPIETLEDSPHFVYISYHTPSLDTFYVNDQLAWSYSNLAWIAINPADGLLYLPSTYSEITQLDAYAIQWTGNGYQFTLQLVRHLQLRDQNGNNLTPSTSPLRAVQGGEFSSNGHLYMSSWDCNNPSNGGIYGFDTNGILYQHIPAIYSAGCGGLDDELEGIDILDLGSGGQIHVTKIDNNWPSDDQLFFMHFGVNAATRSKL